VSTFRDLALFWKLLIPFVALILLFGVLGAFVIVRDLASRAQGTIDRDLSRLSLDASSSIHDRELYLLEAGNFAANLQGMSDAVRTHDASRIAKLLRSVRAIKTDLTLLAVTDGSGAGLVEFARGSSEPVLRRGNAWGNTPFAAHALHDAAGARASGFLDVDGRPTLAIVAPVCSTSPGCSPVGSAIVGISVGSLASGALVRAPSGAVHLTAGVGIYDARQLIGSSGMKGFPRVAPELSDGTPIRRTESFGSEEVTSLYTPLEVHDRRLGTLAVTTPSDAAFASARQAGVRLALILLASLMAVVALGALLSRFILAQVNPLVHTNRALGRGDLSARAEVLGNDELGEVARGVNQMAEQLQASHETLELRVAQRTEEVKRLLDERTEFFASVSHEFRTPLALMLGNAELLLDPAAPKNRKWRTDTTKAIVDSSEHLLTLINDIIELTKTERGRINVDLTDIRLAEVIADLRPTIEGLARGSGLEVSFDVPRTMPAVRADRTRLREIFLNLVDNAVKYTPSPGKIKISAQAGDRKVDVSIADTGAGIPPSARKRIFEPFYRVAGTEAVRGQASSGLGLAITKRLVEAQGGAISFESDASDGTTFTFSLLRADVVAKRRRVSRN
jgi:signal transduction histidine kinase